ncbi:MAG: tetrahydrofolate synthase [Treponema sp.]|jgi:dihydrofolate synthase/folylpolyglutamate synthase|nr:tetrahydrofolate synthase [Treponema sp.]
MKDSFVSSAAVFAWLSRFINLERGQTPKSFKTERMEILATLAGHPETCAPAIHIAGSKGKGSVTGMISAILEAGGIKTARYMSPHVREYRERITAGDDFFDESVYIEAGRELRDICETLMAGAADKFPLFSPGHEGGEGPTFFELLTLYFFLCARRAGRDFMVIETGMGGRLDPTNIASPLVSVITPIELEHTEYLGDTLAAIAGEKAGIIKPGKPLVLAKQADEALRVFRENAAAKNAPLLFFPQAADIQGLSIRREGTDFSLGFKNPALFPAPLALSLPIPGAVQAQNAGLAVLAVKTAFPAIGEDTIRAGLRTFKLPARFEQVCDEPPLIIDGAHTPKSAELTVETFISLYGEGGVLIFGCAAGKDAESMARVLLPHFSRIIITTPGSFKASDPEKLYALFTREVLAQRTGEKTSLICIKNTGKALQTALAFARQRGLPVLGTGSFYLAAELRQALA